MAGCALAYAAVTCSSKLPRAKKFAPLLGDRQIVTFFSPTANLIMKEPDVHRIQWMPQFKQLHPYYCKLCVTKRSSAWVHSLNVSYEVNLWQPHHQYRSSGSSCQQDVPGRAGAACPREVPHALRLSMPSVQCGQPYHHQCEVQQKHLHQNIIPAA